ncbi:MAG: staygreen family protein [Methanomassiliicoccales archaeon]
MMARLDPLKLHTRREGVEEGEPLEGRRYTLTHSDMTGELFLTVARDFDRSRMTGLRWRLMRDEVIGEWRVDDLPELHLYLHVSGGLVLGSASMRDRIFRKELPLVLEAIRLGDDPLFLSRAELGNSRVKVHFRSSRKDYDRVEDWGRMDDHRVRT